MLSPILKEALCWFAIGSALAAFVCTAIIVFAASAPGIGGAAVIRAVGKTVDSVICPERPIFIDRNRLRPARRSVDLFDRATFI